MRKSVNPSCNVQAGHRLMWVPNYLFKQTIEMRHPQERILPELMETEETNASCMAVPYKATMTSGKGSCQPIGGLETISKRFQLHPCTVRRVFYKCRALNTPETLPISEPPSELSTRTTRRIINHVKANHTRSPLESLT